MTKLVNLLWIRERVVLVALFVLFLLIQLLVDHIWGKLCLLSPRRLWILPTLTRHVDTCSLIVVNHRIDFERILQ